MRDFEMRDVKEELIEMDLDDDALREYMMDADTTPTDSRQANMQQIVSGANGDDDTWDAKIDPGYIKLLDSCREDGTSRLRDNPLMCIRYGVDNGGYDKREFLPDTTPQRRREECRSTTRVNKRNVVSKQQPPVQQASTKKKKEREAAALRRKRNRQRNVEASKKEISDEEWVLDEKYKSYLTWLVENAKTPRANTQKEIQVKCEEDTLPLSDSEILAVGDRPFQDDEDSPFVPSKNYKVVDLEEVTADGGDQTSSLFRKELMNVLKQPYNEKEYLELNREASVRRCLTRCRQLRDGRELTYDTKEPRPSYLDEYPDFERMLSDSDPHRALNLLRGFIFYLEKVARVDAFKPWLDPECLSITSSGHKSRSSSSNAIKSEFCEFSSRIMGRPLFMTR